MSKLRNPSDAAGVRSRHRLLLCGLVVLASCRADIAQRYQDPINSPLTADSAVAAPIVAAEQAAPAPQAQLQTRAPSPTPTSAQVEAQTAMPDPSGAIAMVDYQQPLPSDMPTTVPVPLTHVEHYPSEHVATLPMATCNCGTAGCGFGDGGMCAGQVPDQWRPPGIGGIWPTDEYICDGGDQLLQVVVDRDWTVRGIDQQDTVAHYDTLDGKTIVTPSNRVCIYAPRFASVRHVTGAILDQHHVRAAGVDYPLAVNSQNLREGANAVTQPVQVERHKATQPPYAFREQNRALGLDDVRRLQGIDFDLMPYEDLAIIREGRMDAGEKARLAQLATAAKIWEAVDGVQVLIDGQPAVEAVQDVLPQETVVYDMPKGKPRLQICKIASKQNALPGDIVEFTLRYDNVGDQTIGNVTIIDSLTTRLEYIPDTAQSSRDADFFAADNEADSLLLRWELKEPLKVGEGGIVRFQCRVR